MAKVYVVVIRGEDSWIEAAFMSERLAVRYVERAMRRSYAEVLKSHEERRAKAQAWIDAGGGLSQPLYPPATLEEFRARWRWEIEETDLYERLP